MQKQKFNWKIKINCNTYMYITTVVGLWRCCVKLSVYFRPEFGSNNNSKLSIRKDLGQESNCRGQRYCQFCWQVFEEEWIANKGCWRCTWTCQIHLWQSKSTGRQCPKGRWNIVGKKKRASEGSGCDEENSCTAGKVQGLVAQSMVKANNFLKVPIAIHFYWS